MFFIELVEFLELVENAQRKLGNRAPVGRVEIVFLADLLQRLGVFRVLLAGRGVGVVFMEKVDHQTVAQSSLRNENVVELQLSHDLQQDQSSGHDNVSSLGIAAD